MLPQTGACAFVKSFKVEYYLLKEKVEKSIVNVLWKWLGNYLLWELSKRSRYWIHSFLFERKALDRKIDHTLTTIKHILGIFPHLKKIYKTVHLLLSSKSNEMHVRWFIYCIFGFKKSCYMLHILRIYSQISVQLLYRIWGSI